MPVGTSKARTFEKQSFSSAHFLEVPLIHYNAIQCIYYNTLSNINQFNQTLNKINSFNGALAVVKTVGDGLSTIGDSLIYSISTAVSKIFGKFKGKYEEDEDYE